MKHILLTFRQAKNGERAVNDRELFNAIMHYDDFDRMPVFHWTSWPETHREWIEQGMPEDVPEHVYFNASPITHSVGVDIGLHPLFEEEVLEETNAWRIIRQNDGVIAQHWKDQSCIPKFIDYTLKGEDGWEEYKKRLQPCPSRIPENLAERIESAKSATVPVSVPTGSMIGWIRNWMGVENLAYLCYDNRDLLKEMVDTIADLVIWGLEQVLPHVKVDLGWGWEDICFRTGPLISPDIFKEVAVPAYSRIAQKLREYGCDLYLVDCDGLIEHLIPHWLEAGVNVMFPLEIGAWQADPMELRRRFGKELLIFGGIDKRALAQGRAAIDAEIERRLPIMKEGGFVALPDHLIIPGTPLEDYKYYLERIRSLTF